MKKPLTFLLDTFWAFYILTVIVLCTAAWVEWRIAPLVGAVVMMFVGSLLIDIRPAKD